MVTNDRTKKAGYINRAVSAGILAYQKRNQENPLMTSSGDPADTIPVTSDEDEASAQQKPPRAGRARLVSDLAAQNEEFLKIFREKNQRKDNYKKEIAGTFQELVNNTKKRSSITIIGENKV